MTYRKITIGEITYKWIAGKKFLKIVNIGLFDIQEVGIPVLAKAPHYSDLGCEMGDVDDIVYAITPAIVRKLIEEKIG